MTYLEFLQAVKEQLSIAGQMPFGRYSHRLGICHAIFACMSLAKSTDNESLAKKYSEKLIAAVNLELRKLGTSDYYTTALMHAGLLPLNYTQAEGQAARHALLDRFIKEAQQNDLP